MSVERIGPREAKERMENGWIYVDVRSIPEYEEGHPEGAFNVPWRHATPSGMEPNPNFLQVMERCFGKDAKLIVGCRSGGRSLQAAETLAAAGFRHVADQRAGFEGKRDPFGGYVEAGWKPSGLPVAQGSEPGRGYRELCERAGVEDPVAQRIR